MSIDVHKIIDGRTQDHILSINSTEYAEILPAIELYRAKTGLFIDQYSDLKLSSGVKPLIESLEAKSTGSQIYKSLISVLKKSELEGYGIIFIGE
ncbi:hypothetical protein [Marinobacterium lutimaris]|uniref:Uncharacterized protein n=1 Tax=Marinobacterium lutimaris TaxID=568106 RepID=A0A1H5TXY7_9GAMM|nr:hypothetical protein [Marinobacterium lutimaris]SEF67643.1 hypothetical protein SAMN05444390_101203 [Marinobacterium lutimaris]